MEDIETANRLKPEYIGFVFWEKSSRYVTPSQALELRRALLPQIRAVGVFVDEEPEKAASYLSEGMIDLAQLHGSEDRNYIRALRRLAPEKEIIKALQIRDGVCLEDELLKYRGAEPDYFLLDSGTGSGQVFNWELISSLEIERPFFLAGGLDPDNVANAVDRVRPFGVDVSSGIETDKKKDPVKMENFVEVVRSRI